MPRQTKRSFIAAFGDMDVPQMEKRRKVMDMAPIVRMVGRTAPLLTQTRKTRSVRAEMIANPEDGDDRLQKALFVPPRFKSYKKTRSVAAEIAANPEDGDDQLRKALFVPPRKLECELPQDVIDSGDMAQMLGCMPTIALELMSLQNYQMQQIGTNDVIQDPRKKYGRVLTRSYPHRYSTMSFPDPDTNKAVVKMVSNCTRCPNIRSGSFDANMAQMVANSTINDPEIAFQLMAKIKQYCHCSRNSKTMKALRLKLSNHWNVLGDISPALYGKWRSEFPACQ